MKIVGYVVALLIVMGAVLPQALRQSTQFGSAASSDTYASDDGASSAILTYHGFGNYTFDGQDKVKASVKKATDIIHIMGESEMIDSVGYTKDMAEYTITSTGTSFKGYVDYTDDGYAVVMQPRSHSLTKGEFKDILDTFSRVD